MFRILMCVLFTFVACLAEAAPRNRRYTYTTPAQQQPQRVSAYTSMSEPTSGGHTGSAQGVAEMMANRGVMQHFGGNSGYEGVGMGSTPEQALGNCCYSNSGMRVVDQGVACGRNGRWYACKRYR
jgi:hypothetical protein